MPYRAAYDFYRCIDVLHAEESQAEIVHNNFSEYKKDDRSKIWNSLKKATKNVDRNDGTPNLAKLFAKKSVDGNG
jgi:hypothetical protein